MARIFYFSHPSRIASSYEKLYHVSSTRSFWMGAELARLGHEVTAPVYGAWPPAKEPPRGMKFVPFADIPQLDKFDLVFCHLVGPSYRLLLDCAFAGQYERRPVEPKVASKLESYVSELPVFLQSDHPLSRVHRDDRLDEFGKSRLRAVGLSAPNAACGVGCRSFYCPPSVVPDRPDAPPPPDPYAASRRAGRPVVVYLGRLNDNCRPSMSQRLNEIARAAPEVDFYIISGKVRGGSVQKIIVVHDDDENREVHQGRMTLISDLFTASNVTFIPTPSYDRTFRYLMHADVGVALSVRVGQDIASCKMWEYVSCGLPAVCDNQLPEAFLCQTYGLSDPFPFGDARAAAAAIRRALRSGVNRADLIRRMRREHSYHERAERWSRVFQDAGFGGGSHA
jgi:hypothetical protein